MKDITALKEPDLLSLARSGEPDAFGALWILYQDMVIAIIFRYVSDREVARDILMMVANRAWEKIGQFRQEAAFPTWLYPIAVHTCINMRRKRMRIERYEVSEGVSIDKALSNDPPPNDSLAKQELREMLLRAISRLPTRLKQVMQCELHDMKTADGAMLCRCTAEAYRKRYIRAIAILKMLCSHA